VIAPPAVTPAGIFPAGAQRGDRMLRREAGTIVSADVIAQQIEGR
jgi:hypothetical protein